MNEQPAYPPDGVWHFNNWPETYQDVLKRLCQRVEKLFELPACRLCRYFASAGDGWDGYFVRESGRYYRGMHIPLSSSGCLPPGLAEYFYARRRGPMTGNEPPRTLAEAKFDALIYIRHSTCDDKTGSAITYAHELQHVVQHARFPQLGKVNQVLRKSHKLQEIDIPSEQDANIISKRIAELICGAANVREFAEKQISAMEQAYKTGEAGASAHRVRWEFFRDISSCDISTETLLLAPRFKKELHEAGIDIDRPGWFEDRLISA